MLGVEAVWSSVLFEKVPNNEHSLHRNQDRSLRQPLRLAMQSSWTENIIGVLLLSSITNQENMGNRLEFCSFSDRRICRVFCSGRMIAIILLLCFVEVYQALSGPESNQGRPRLCSVH